MSDADLPQSGAEVLARPAGGGTAGASGSHLAPFFESWLDTFVFHGRVDAKLRELTILRVMWRCDQSFQWANHYRLARAAGLSRDEILEIRTSRPERDLHHDVAVVVRAADDVVERGHLAPETYRAVRALLAEEDLIQEFLYLVAGYRMFASVTEATGMTAESAGLLSWPPDGVGPGQRIGSPSQDA